MREVLLLVFLHQPILLRLLSEVLLLLTPLPEVAVVEVAVAECVLSLVVLSLC